MVPNTHKLVASGVTGFGYLKDPHNPFPTYGKRLPSLWTSLAFCMMGSNNAKPKCQRR